ncbi:hypothetical protein [Oleidesulfovibrio alaskensis]|uniref:hypothetical protein n=1 Tax=Oleidesulfovibrio alaskensis TaxID=58180 RepID=UPI0004883CFA|nr:hypothetical protein [Oleidesulfovibrio alaskensis]
MATLGRYTLFAIVALIISLFSMYAKSDFIEKILIKNSFEVSITLFAIFISLASILATQIKILHKVCPVDIKKISRTMHGAMLEFIIVIVFTLVINIIHSGELFSIESNIVFKVTIDVLFVEAMFVQLWIIYDFLKSILTIIQFEDS